MLLFLNKRANAKHITKMLDHETRFRQQHYAQKSENGGTSYNDIIVDMKKFSLRRYHLSFLFF